MVEKEDKREERDLYKCVKRLRKNERDKDRHTRTRTHTHTRKDP